MLQVTLFVFVILIALFMALKRYRNNEPKYAIAWLLCALFNVYFLIVYLTQPATA